MKILVVGSHGMLSQELNSCLSSTEFSVVNCGLPKLDITKKKTISEIFDEEGPNLVINAAAYTEVDLAETNPEIAYAVNAEGPRNLAKQCCKMDIPLIHISTDYVFDGTRRSPYHENDIPRPMGVYGKSKLEGERAVQECHGKHIIIRTSWLYSVYGRNFLKTMLQLGKERVELRVINDQWGCPTSAKDLAYAINALCLKGVNGISSANWGVYHYCGAGLATWYDFASYIIQEARPYLKLAVQHVVPILTAEYKTVAPRPLYSVLDCSKIYRVFGISARNWKLSSRQCMQEIHG